MNRTVSRLVGQCVAAAGIATLSLTVYPTNRLTSQSRQWRPEERVLITDFSHVDALAASPANVYAATSHGLVIYDRRGGRWRLPVTTLDGYPRERVRVALADLVEHVVWLETIRGWVRYDATLRIWEQGVPPPAGQRIGRLDLETALAQAPAADALRALILTDSRLRGHRFTAAARSPDRPELFLGTNGLGVVRVDPRTGEWERLEFGLVGPRVGAVAVGVDGVWAACTGRAGRPGGVTWVAGDLSRTMSNEHAPGAEGRDLLAHHGALWVATDRGVYRIEGGGWGVGGTVLGRPVLAEAASSLAPAPDGVWVGTSRGVFVVSENEARRAIPIPDATEPVLALLAVRESLWIGTPTGLRLLGAQSLLAAPITALGRVGDTLVATAGDRLAWRAPHTGQWTLVVPPVELGRLVALASDATGGGGVWVGGTLGLAHWRITPSVFRTLRVPGDLPAGARDLASDGDWLWVATDSGLVRFDARAVRGS